jgi:ribosomal protein S18 acetylase RimI-like enzyme
MTKVSPLELRVPNAETRAAMEESRAMMQARQARFMDVQDLLTSSNVEPLCTLEPAEPSDLELLLPLVAAYHHFEDVQVSAGLRKNSVARLLGDRSLGEIWLIKTADRIVGYIAVCFSYSIEFGGRDAFIDEFFVEREYRGKGIGSKAIAHVTEWLRGHGFAALHLEVDSTNERATAAYERAGFAIRDKYHVMSLGLS